LIELFADKKVAEEEVRNRGCYLLRMTPDGIESFSGKVAKEKIQEFQKNPDTAQSVQGTVAYPGKVVAKARVIPIDIREYATIHELVEAMQPGEVLVAETTEPAIILACQKASAIVTNQGGMMSHAAITAREMQIPCIVGTGNATKNIRTGDMIEVDADKGMVRILQTAMID
jgi:pyruvate,water dikinase